MTVSQLIEKLGRLNPQLRVVLEDDERGYYPAHTAALHEDAFVNNKGVFTTHEDVVVIV
jgi:hypothetical protein